MTRENTKEIKKTNHSGKRVRVVTIHERGIAGTASDKQDATFYSVIKSDKKSYLP